MKRCPHCNRQFPDDANFCPADAGRLEPDAGDTHRGVPPVTGSTAPPPIAPVADDALGGRFDLGAPLGGGLTGEVFQAGDRQSGQRCAVKVVHSRVFPNPLLLQRAERELKQLERVQLAEVTRVLGHGRKGEQLWIAMEMVDAVPLDRLVAQSGPMPAARACSLIRSIAQGLAEVAKQGVIHRDLAPKNVLVGAADAVKIINFSIAVPFSDKVQGVPEFLSPEQIDGKPADQRSSIYSLGALLYFAVTGRPPFTGDPQAVHQAHLGQEPARPSQVVGASPALDAIVLKAMEKHSAKRFMTLHQLMGELDSFMSGGAAHAVAAAHGKAPMPAGATLLGTPFAAAGGGDGSHGYVPGSPMNPSPAFGAPPAMMPAPPPMHASPPIAPPQAPTMHQHEGHAPVLISKASLPPSAGVMAPSGAGKAGKGKAKGGGGGGGGGENKGKFRETMWFKKGELDEAAAAAAAAMQEGELANDKADALPIEDRYKDDGTLSRQDAERLSLRTGATQMMQAMRDPNMAQVAPRNVSESDLVGEMKSGRGMLILAIFLGIAAAAGLIAYFVN